MTLLGSVSHPPGQANPAASNQQGAFVLMSADVFLIAGSHDRVPEPYGRRARRRVATTTSPISTRSPTKMPTSSSGLFAVGRSAESAAVG
jgi:hypothetical protein